MHLIIGKDKEESRRALEALLRDVSAPRSIFNADTFSLGDFLQEVETPPFLSPKKAIILHALDQLTPDAKEGICRYLEKPSPWISLFMTAGELTSQSKIAKLMEKNGKVLRFKEEKPWEKEKRQAQWLIDEAKREGVKLSMRGALALVQGVDHQMLRSELDKLICFACTRKEITLEDIAQLSTPVHHETVWQLGEALFALNAARALQIGRSLLAEGMAIFPLLASLRSQFITGIDVLAGGPEVAKKYPYLKGALLDKKLQLFRKYGQMRLQKGVALLFETEVRAKNSSSDPAILLELLMIRLIIGVK